MAFLNVSVQEENRDVLRYPWVDDVKKESPEVVFARIKYGVLSSQSLPTRCNDQTPYGEI